MASLIRKKLSNLQIGSEVSVTYFVDSTRNDILQGSVTDNDFESCIEITPANGQAMILDYSIIRSVTNVALASVPLPAVTHVPAFASESAFNSQQRFPETPFLQRELRCDFLECSDYELRQHYQKLSKNEKNLLNRYYDSFRYGEDQSDAKKMETAAKKASSVFFDEYDRGFNWSAGACWFCGMLLYRVKCYDPEIFMLGGFTWEAAISAWKNGDKIQAACFAAIALEKDNGEKRDDLLTLLAAGMHEASDLSPLRLFRSIFEKRYSNEVLQIVNELLRQRNLPEVSNPFDQPSLHYLALQFPNEKLEEEILNWMPKTEPEEETNQEEHIGWISRIRWSDQTGQITEGDADYPFQYADLLDKIFRGKIQSSFSATPSGGPYWVRFYVRNGRAVEIQNTVSPLNKAREAMEKYRYQDALDWAILAAKDSSVSDALPLIAEAALNAYRSERNPEALARAKSSCIEYKKEWKKSSKFLGLFAQICFELGELTNAIKYTAQALEIDNRNEKFKVTLLTQFVRFQIQLFNERPNEADLPIAKQRADQALVLYRKEELQRDEMTQKYYSRMLRWHCRLSCELGVFDEAEEDMRELLTKYPDLPKLNDLQKTIILARKKQAKTDSPIEEVQPPREEDTPEAPDEEGRQSDVSPQKADAPLEDALRTNDPHLDDSAQSNGMEDEEETEVPVYEDHDGWQTLNTSVEEVVDYALSQQGLEAVPLATAYLRASSQLCPEIRPVYLLVSLAANDPAETHSLQIASLRTLLEDCAPEFAVLANYCVSSAYLRAAFLADWGYGFGADVLSTRLQPTHEFSDFQEAIQLLTEFLEKVGQPMDWYTDYRNVDVMLLSRALDDTVAEAQDLYTKFIENPPREGVRFARLLETKKLLFDRNGELARLLKAVMHNDTAFLQAEKAKFEERFLSISSDGNSRIRPDAIDELIINCWNLAPRNLEVKKNSKDLQGSRRNNLRSNLKDILSVLARWYQLSEQNAGLTGRSLEGEQLFTGMRSRLTGHLTALAFACGESLEVALSNQERMGLMLLQRTALELVQRLNGQWKYGQERYFYFDLLRSDNILLDQDFLPDFSATLCALPKYNVLARLRLHMEGKKLEWQAHLDAIYGQNKTENNYGTAQRILEWAHTMEPDLELHIPENAELYQKQTERSCEMRLRSFLESYALDRNLGRIMQSDLFCSTLEDTVQYWYYVCQESKNFGFFLQLLQHVEERIHEGAANYEHQLLELLKALMERNPQLSAQYPSVEESIREQITQQNFIVAEDWMNKLRAGDFSMELQQPEALGYLERFWTSYPSNLNRVGDAGRPLSHLIGRKSIRNKDAKGGQLLVDCWLNNGSRSTPSRIEQLLLVLGWKEMNVRQHEGSFDNDTEIYDAVRNPSVWGYTPLHPIAVFGSELSEKGMQVVCLYGSYECDRLYEKIRVLDVLDGNKLILLDYALGSADRRLLAKKLKYRESGLHNTYLVVDRVLLCFLADHYNENLINRMLMAVAMPFSYCQPYVVESIHTMPPEIFIGRKDELLRIEQPDGVNLIYGGRQLGKSALFKKARQDLDGKYGRRAVLVDINTCDCASTARKLSRELEDLGILPEGSQTESWEQLSTTILKRMRNSNDIRYLLIMLDEADTFIEDCGRDSYRPLVWLKDIQQTLQGRFKFVLAGLHNVVRFNRDVALGRNAVITHLPSMKITPFRTAEAQELLIEPLSYLGLSLPSRVTVSQILATVNYFPGLIQLYCKKLIESLRSADYAGYNLRTTPPYIIRDEHIRRVMADKDFVQQIQEKFEDTLKLDQDKQQKHLGYYYPLALIVGWLYYEEPEKLREGYSAQDIMRQAKDLCIIPLLGLDTEKIDTLLQELQDLNILRGVSHDTYLLASKRFRDLLGTQTQIFDKLCMVNEVSE